MDNTTHGAGNKPTTTLGEREMRNERFRELERMAQGAAEQLWDAQQEQNWMWANRARSEMLRVAEMLRELQREED